MKLADLHCDTPLEMYKHDCNLKMIFCTFPSRIPMHSKHISNVLQSGVIIVCQQKKRLTYLKKLQKIFASKQILCFVQTEKS